MISADIHARSVPEQGHVVAEAQEMLLYFLHPGSYIRLRWPSSPMLQKALDGQEVLVRKPVNEDDLSG